MSLPKALAERTLSRITTELGLHEVHGPDGGPLMTLRSAMSPHPVGAMRAFRGDAVERVVCASMVVPPIGLDSHMIFAFTPPSSPIPHFTVDAVKTGDFFAFHLDLIPRADIGAELAYVNATLQPLTATFEETQKIEGLSPAMLSPRQRALMSPWMLAYRATEAAFDRIGTSVSAYLDHWMQLVRAGVPGDVTGSMNVDWAARDRKSRAAIFSPETDPVWIQVDRLLGADQSARMRSLLTSQTWSEP
jgi:hypothetical protein